jgi:hypothetical protein
VKRVPVMKRRVMARVALASQFDLYPGEVAR